MPVFLISAAAAQGIGKVLDEIIKILAKNPIVAPKEIEAAGPAIHAVAPMFTVTRLDEDRVQISGKKIEEFISMTNFSQPEAVQRLRGIFKKIGLEKALLKEGVTDGSVIVACGKEFEWNGSEVDEEVSALPDRIGGYKRRETKAERLAKRKARRAAKSGD